jgi:hypothetical protein
MTKFESIMLFHYTSISFHLTELLLNQKLFLTEASNFNDPFEGVTFYGKNVVPKEDGQFDEMEIAFAPKLTYRAICFSGNRQDHLMWSHYGDSHRGVCLGFEFDKFEAAAEPTQIQRANQIYYFGKIQYVPELPSRKLVHGEDIIGGDDAELIPFRKLDRWDREDETRIASVFDPDTNPFFPFGLNELKEINFGLMVKANEMETVINACRKSSIPASFNQAKVSKNHRDIHFYPLESQS